MISGTDSRLHASSCCIVVPTFNNAPFLPAFLDELSLLTHRVVIVNDGSTDDTNHILAAYQNKFHIIHHAANRGKGMALRTAFREAYALGYRHAITIDSDGQHLLNDLGRFLDEIERNPGSMIVGARNMDQESVPGKSSFGNRFSNFWYYVETFISLPDTQSGYRLYPLEPISRLKFFTRKYEFEIEVLVRLAWMGVRVTSVPVSVVYHPEGKRISHFRPAQDFFRISVLNSVLVLLAFFFYHPRNFFRAVNVANTRKFVEKNILRTGASNIQLAIEIGFGVFMGIFPIWGYQMLAAAFLAHLFKLNKVLVLLASNISVPPMIPFIVYGSYMMGGLVLGFPESPLKFNDELTVAAMGEHLLQYLAGAVFLAITAGALVGLLVFVLLSIFRKPLDNRSDG